MLLYLRILTYRDEPVPPAAAAAFSAAGGTIGRAPDNALVLDDASKYISRVHARVAMRGTSFYLEDIGSNPSVLNDRPLGKGRETVIAHGDRLTIGDYQLQAMIEEGVAAPILPSAFVNNTDLPLFEAPAPPPPVQLPPLEPVARPQIAPDMFAPAGLPDALAGASILDIGPGDGYNVGGDDPLGLNLFVSGPPVPMHAAESDHVSPELAAFAMPSLHVAAPPPAPPVTPASPPAATGGFSIPHDYDPLADFFAPPLVKSEPAPPVDTSRPDPVHPPLPRPQPPVEHALVAPVTPPPPIAAAESDILQALLRGLGLPELRIHRPATEVAEIVGSMLREATAGTIDVLMARAVTKKENRMDVTILSVRENNPLKFFPNAEGALTQMLTGSMAGYMAPGQAMAGAFDDLRAHELAVIAGMRAALGAVLHRFDPEQIEARLAVPTVMDKMLTSNRKAKMWDRLVELYGDIAREADDDMQRLFGEKFSEAYEDQVARLRQAKKNQTP